MKVSRAVCWRTHSRRRILSCAAVFAVAWFGASAIYNTVGFNQVRSTIPIVPIQAQQITKVNVERHPESALKNDGHAAIKDGGNIQRTDDADKNDVDVTVQSHTDQETQRPRNERRSKTSTNTKTTSKQKASGGVDSSFEVTEKRKDKNKLDTKRGRSRHRPAWIQKHTASKSVQELRSTDSQYDTALGRDRRLTKPSSPSGFAVLPVNTRLEAVVVYMTHPAEFSARRHIRDTIAYTYTLGEYKHIPVAFYFVTGSDYIAKKETGQSSTVDKQTGDEPIAEAQARFSAQDLYDEADSFKDMVILDGFEEDYFKLTLKTATSIAEIDELFNLANTTARWYVKTDTDACVDHAVLLRTLTKNGARTRAGDSAWMGMLYHEVPTRPGGNDSKWDDHTYAPATYPPYMNGPLYALTWALVDTIATRYRQDDLIMYANEDAAVGVWLNESKIVPTPIEIKFPQWVERKYYITPAVCWDVPLVVHGCFTESDHIYYRSRGFCNRHDRDDGLNTINTTRIGNGDRLKVVLGAKIVQIRPVGGTQDGLHNPISREPKRRERVPDILDSMGAEEKADKSAECVKQGLNSWHQCRKYLRDIGLL